MEGRAHRRWRCRRLRQQCRMGVQPVLFPANKRLMQARVRLKKTILGQFRDKIMNQVFNTVIQSPQQLRTISFMQDTDAAPWGHKTALQLSSAEL
jgi:hypothetical protein